MLRYIALGFSRIRLATAKQGELCEERVVDGQPVGLDLAALIAEHKQAARKFV
jgi:hypothetical protein